jgi:hypothetical protein
MHIIVFFFLEDSHLEVVEQSGGHPMADRARVERAASQPQESSRTDKRQEKEQGEKRKRGKGNHT